MNRNANGQFEKGFYGNPSGRPKRTEIETELIHQICSLAPQAFNALKELIMSKETPANIRLKCCEIVIERICGRPMSAADLKQYETIPEELSEVEKEKQRLWNEIELNLLR